MNFIILKMMSMMLMVVEPIRQRTYRKFRKVIYQLKYFLNNYIAFASQMKVILVLLKRKTVMVINTIH